MHRALERGRDAGCEAVQIFTRSARQWASRPIAEDEVRAFAAARAATGIRALLAHDSYLYNPAAPDEALSRSQLRSLMARAIAELPDDARRTIELREIDGLSYQEIAQALSIPKGTVMSRLHYARRRLAAALRAAGAPGFAGGEEDR